LGDIVLEEIYRWSLEKWKDSKPIDYGERSQVWGDEEAGKGRPEPDAVTGSNRRSRNATASACVRWD